ncbi:hypothetical protein AOLI_G00059460 [Acnodon oligacanthus]
MSSTFNLDPQHGNIWTRFCKTSNRGEERASCVVNDEAGRDATCIAPGNEQRKTREPLFFFLEFWLCWKVQKKHPKVATATTPTKKKTNSGAELLDADSM